MTPARLIDATPVTDDWWLIRIEWTAESPAPGQWLWLDLNGQRCCLPVRDADTGEGWLAGILPGAQLPAGIRPGTPVAVSSLQGRPIQTNANDRLLILGEDLGVGPAIALAERHPDQTRLVLLGGEHGLPGRLVPSRFFIPALADVAIAGLASLEQAGVPARVALNDDRPGVHEGGVLNLLGRYLSDTPEETRQTLRLIAFGPWHSLHPFRNGVAATVNSVEWVELPAKPA
ncbi:hypothetical protein [Spiribacter vilamensis]|uniref:Uncharacterized protein n=1 Tax=Spiribacter vilamensis TaxID=531306 RepID=A0A4Q8D1M9_9GAMM|nr:hypothetical protein [Spiribacter vilamensis]RZU99214.1 hypothetical protein EV698_1496 [Spiribacter vilamensis]TVO61798.1 hypothetical protein FPL09_06730 [Spiribacter vilamensis]